MLYFYSCDIQIMSGNKIVFRTHGTVEVFKELETSADFDDIIEIIEEKIFYDIKQLQDNISKDDVSIIFTAFNPL